MITETFSSLQHRCSKTKALRCGLSPHAVVLKTGTQSDVFMSNHVLNVSWLVAISCYDQAREPQMAIDLYSKIFLVPNKYVFASVISTCARLASTSHGKQTHAHLMRKRLYQDLGVDNPLVNMFDEVVLAMYVIYSAKWSITILSHGTP